MSWGKGIPQKDVINVVFLDQMGRLREHTSVDNLTDLEQQQAFLDIVNRRTPDIIVLGGFSHHTMNLRLTVHQLIADGGSRSFDTHGMPDQDRSLFARQLPLSSVPIHFVFDSVARIYQHSKRAASEFSALTTIQKYCIGLARYVQSPLNEYAALGHDLLAISFSESQSLVRTRRCIL